MPAGQECNAALRLMNNNYVSDGTGRDRMMFLDPGFKGGTCMMTSTGVHQNHSVSQPAPKKQPMDKIWNKFEMRPYDNSNRKAAKITHKASLMESRLCRSMPNLPSGEHLFGTHESNVAFARTRGLSCSGTFRAPPPPAKPRPPTPVKQEYGKGDLYRHQYAGISRAPYGGFWRTYSMIGPG